MPSLKSNALVVYGAGAAHNGGQPSGGQVVRRQKKGKSQVRRKPQPTSLVVRQPRTNVIPPWAQLMSDPKFADLTARPDHNTLPSRTLRLKQVYPLSANADGYCGIFIRNGLNQQFAVPTFNTTTPSIIDSWQSDSTNSELASLNSDYAEFRSHAMSVEWQPDMPVNSAKGRGVMITYPGMVSYTTNLPSSMVQIFNHEGLNFPATHEAAGIVRTSEQPTFSTLSSTDTHCESVCIVFTGLPPGETIGQIVVHRVLEFHAYPKDGERLGLSHSACDMLACGIASNVQGPAASAASGPRPYERLVANGLKMAGLAARGYMAYNSGGLTEVARLATRLF